MSEHLVFYTNPMSRGAIVRWMLEEVGAPYDVEVIEYGEPMKSDAYLAINPMGKVPAIRHGDVVVTECAAICAYLADAFPDAGLAPPPAERGPYYRWLFFAAGPLEAATTNRMLGFETTEEQEQMVGYGTLETVIDALEAALAGGGHVAGEQFSAADVYVGSHLGWGMDTMKTIESRPAFVDYWKRVSTREARRRAEALDNALMPEGGAPGA